MSGHRFDELTKGLANGSASRRAFLTGLAGAAAGALLGSGRARAIVPPGGSTCANAGQSCTAQQCCAGLNCLLDQTSGTDRFCCVGNVVCAGRCCPTGVVTGCINGQCPPCPTGLSVCPGSAAEAGECVDLLTDERNCGSCGHQCAGDQECVGGVCVCTPNSCPTGCCDPATQSCKAGNTSAFCGSNGTACVQCVAGQECQNGSCACTPASCSSGCCENNQCQPGNSNTACGTGGVTCVACPTATECQNGFCVSVCGPGTCTGCCENSQCQPGNSNTACGTGGATCVACPTGTQCQNGSCVCGPGACSGCCVNNVCQPGNTNLLCGSGGGTCVTCSGTNVCCTSGMHTGTCKGGPGASCQGNGNCCSNRCRSNVCV
jgi:hypothetical protein